MQLFASSLGAESTGVLLIYLNAAPVQYAVGNAVLIILGPVIVALTYAGRGRGRCVRLMQISLLGCVAPIRAEHHRRLHQNREDRQAVMCSTSDSANASFDARGVIQKLAGVRVRNRQHGILVGLAIATRLKATGKRSHRYLPTVTPAVERKASLRLVAFMSSSTSRVRKVVCPGMLRIGSVARGDERRSAL
jgi:hypothetical protein